MPVVNGQAVSAEVTNPAFIDAQVDDQAIGKIDFANAEAVSGPTVLNVQREVNSLNSFTGRISGSIYNALPAWLASYVGTVSDTIKDRVDAIVALFSGSLGHAHTGVDGDGKQIDKLNLATNQVSDGSTGDIDALSTATSLSIRLIASVTSVRGVANGSAGKQVTIMNATGADFLVKNLFGAPVSVANRIVTGTGGDITIKSNAAVVLEYDATTLVWRVTGGPGGETIVAYQEVPSGVVDGINDTFGPFSLTPVNTDSVLVFVDGLEQDKSFYTIPTNSVVFGAGYIPATGQSVYVHYLYKTSGGTSPNIGLTVLPKTEYITLSSGDITAGQFTLANTPTVPSEILLDTANGTINTYSVDFTVSGSVVSWTGLGLDGVLAAGDVVRVHYYY